MRNQKNTIRRIVGMLNNEDDDGGLWLPNIQRPFVWSEDQTCRLFDSILRQYPISTLLVWRTNSDVRRRRFIDLWRSSLRLRDFYVPMDTRKKGLVLDGQQRLQSLFIGLKGSFEGKELYFDVLSGDIVAPDDIRFRFKFLLPEEAAFPWLRFKDLVFTNKLNHQLLGVVRSAVARPLNQDETDKIANNLELISKTIKTDEVVTYQELDSIDDPLLYSEDDVVEIFIRANSGGTKLGKSDLLFSLLAASWEVANDRMEELLDDLNRHGFRFDRDFVLKTALTVLGHGARYEVKKFRRPGVREQVEESWERLSDSIRDVVDFVRNKTFIQGDKGLPTYLVLIPLIYLRYHFQTAWRTATDVDTYLLRCSLAGAFSGNPDSLLDALTPRIDKLKSFDLAEMYGVVRNQNRSLELTEDRLWQMGYGSESVHLLFNLWYPRFSYVPSYDDNLPQIDHIFAQSLLREVKVINPQSGRAVRKYSDDEKNQLANCMLLTREENGAGGKGATPPAEWFKKRLREDPNYLDLHLIPKDRGLWELDRFEDFVAARKVLIREKFAWLLVGSQSVSIQPAESSARSSRASVVDLKQDLDPSRLSSLLDDWVVARGEDIGRLNAVLDLFTESRRLDKEKQ